MLAKHGFARKESERKASERRSAKGSLNLKIKKIRLAWREESPNGVLPSPLLVT